MDRLSVDDSALGNERGKTLLDGVKDDAVVGRRRQRSVTVSGGEASRSMLVETLMNPEKARYFKDFLEQEHNNENMLFWIHVSEFQTLAATPHEPEQLRVKAQSIYNTFVAPDAPQSVNLSSVNRKGITAGLEKDVVAFTLFDDAKLEVFRLMEADPFPRFLRSMSFLCMLSGKYQLQPRLFEEFNEQIDGSDWKIMKDNKKGFKSYRKSYKDNPDTNSILAHTVIQVRPEVVEKVLASNDVVERKEFDPMIDEYRIVERISDTMEVIYMRFTKVVFLSPRDTVLLRVRYTDPKGVRYVVARSVVHEDIPVDHDGKGCQRIEVEASGFRIVPLVTDSGEIHSTVTYINQAKTGKQKPMVAKQISKRRAKTLKRLKQYLERTTTSPQSGQS